MADQIFNFAPLTAPLNTAAGAGVQSFFDRILHLLLFVAYPLAFVAILYSAWQLVTSAGDPAAYAKARKNITFLIIGIFIITMAYAIPKFIIGIFGG